MPAYCHYKQTLHSLFRIFILPYIIDKCIFKNSLSLCFYMCGTIIHIKYSQVNDLYVIYHLRRYFKNIYTRL
jgi:hypothetical protein